MDFRAIGLGIGAVIVLISMGAMFINRDSAGEEWRERAKAAVAEVAEYKTAPDYFDWIAEQAHDEVFEQCWVMERSGGRRGGRDTSHLNEAKYWDLLWKAMMKQAGDEGRPWVVTALHKHRVQGSAAEEPAPKPRRKKSTSAR